MAEKKQKTKGPLRWEAIVPALIFFLLAALYMHFFFDNHLRRLIELGATRAHGAEVNVARLQFKPFKGSLKIEGIEVTDASFPERNLFEVGKIHLDVLGDALLRAKVVVERADLLDIRVHSPRRRAGRVLPRSQQPAVTDEAKAIALAQLERNYDQSVLGDLGKLLAGVSAEDQLKAMEAELKSSAKLKELEQAISSQKAQWESEIQNLPGEEELKAYEARFDGIKKDGFKDVREVQKSVQAFEALFREVDQEVKALEAATSQVQSSLSWADAQLKEANSLAQSDVKALLDRLNIPSLDSDSLTQALFAGLVLSKIRPLFSYLEQAERYIPTKKKQDLPITPRERREGRNHQFPITAGYPRFWLKSSQISSQSSPGADYGSFQGKLTNVTDNPRFVGQPAVLELQGEVPSEGLSGIFAQITVDHTGEIPHQSFDFKLASYPAPEHILTQSEQVTFGFSEAKGSASLKGEVSSGKLALEFFNEYLEPRFVVNSSSGSLKAILERATSGIQKLDLRARLELGEGLKLNMRSNLGGEIERAVKNEISHQVQSAQLAAQKFVQQAYGAQKQKLDELIRSVEQQVRAPLIQKKQALEDGKKRIDQAKDQALKQQTKEAEGKLKEEGKKLLKGLGF